MSKLIYSEADLKLFEINILEQCKTLQREFEPLLKSIGLILKFQGINRFGKSGDEEYQSEISFGIYRPIGNMELEFVDCFDCLVVYKGCKILESTEFLEGGRNQLQEILEEYSSSHSPTILEA